MSLVSIDVWSLKNRNKRNQNCGMNSQSIFGVECQFPFFVKCKPFLYIHVKCGHIMLYSCCLSIHLFIYLSICPSVHVNFFFATLLNPLVDFIESYKERSQYVDVHIARECCSNTCPMDLHFFLQNCLPLQPVLNRFGEANP